MRTPHHGVRDDAAGAASWLTFLLQYIAIIAAANLLWEAAQLPLYTIWAAASAKQIAFAVLHCTAGNVARHRHRSDADRAVARDSDLVFWRLRTVKPWP